MRRAGRALVPVLLGLAACRRPPDPDVLATWDQGVLKTADLDAHFLAQPPSGRLPGEGQDRVAWLEGQTRQLFARQMLAASPDRSALDSDPLFVKGLARRVRHAQAAAYLAPHNARFEVTLDEARREFERDQARWSSPERRAFRHLLVAVPPGAPPASRAAACARAEDLRRQVLAGASFEDLSQQHSDSANASTGGLVGAVRRQDLRPDVAAAVFALEPGQVSPVLRNAAGCQLFALAELIPAHATTFELARDTLLRELAERRRREWRSRLLREAASTLSVALPPWIDGGRPPSINEASVVLEFGDEKVLGRDLLAAGAALPAVLAFERVAGDMLFAAVLERDDAAQAARIRQEVRSAFEYEHLRRQGLWRYVSGQKPDPLQRYYESHRATYMSDAQMEATLHVWPLPPGDPLKAMAGPQAMADALRGPPAAAGQAWQRARGEGAHREVVARASLRELLLRRPELGPALAGPLADGQVVGPYRFARRLLVLRVDAFVPSRQLGFLEVRERVLADLIRDEGTALEAGWIDEMAARERFRIQKDALVSFGQRLLSGGP